MEESVSKSERSLIFTLKRMKKGLVILIFLLSFYFEGITAIERAKARWSVGEERELESWTEDQRKAQSSEEHFKRKLQFNKRPLFIKAIVEYQY